MRKNALQLLLLGPRRAFWKSARVKEEGCSLRRVVRQPAGRPGHHPTPKNHHASLHGDFRNTTLRCGRSENVLSSSEDDVCHVPRFPVASGPHSSPTLQPVVSADTDLRLHRESDDALVAKGLCCTSTYGKARGYAFQLWPQQFRQHSSSGGPERHLSKEACHRPGSKSSMVSTETVTTTAAHRPRSDGQRRPFQLYNRDLRESMRPARSHQKQHEFGAGSTQGHRTDSGHHHSDIFALLPLLRQAVFSADRQLRRYAGRQLSSWLRERKRLLTSAVPLSPAVATQVAVLCPDLGLGNHAAWECLMGPVAMAAAKAAAVAQTEVSEMLESAVVAGRDNGKPEAWDIPGGSAASTSPASASNVEVAASPSQTLTRQAGPGAAVTTATTSKPHAAERSVQCPGSAAMVWPAWLAALTLRSAMACGLEDHPLMPPLRQSLAVLLRQITGGYDDFAACSRIADASSGPPTTPTRGALQVLLMHTMEEVLSGADKEAAGRAAKAILMKPGESERVLADLTAWAHGSGTQVVSSGDRTATDAELLQMASPESSVGAAVTLRCVLVAWQVLQRQEKCTTDTAALDDRQLETIASLVGVCRRRLLPPEREPLAMGAAAAVSGMVEMPVSSEVAAVIMRRSKMTTRKAVAAVSPAAKAAGIYEQGVGHEGATFEKGDTDMELWPKGAGVPMHAWRWSPELHRWSALCEAVWGTLGIATDILIASGDPRISESSVVASALASGGEAVLRPYSIGPEGLGRNLVARAASSGVRLAKEPLAEQQRGLSELASELCRLAAASMYGAEADLHAEVYRPEVGHVQALLQAHEVLRCRMGVGRQLASAAPSSNGEVKNGRGALCGPHVGDAVAAATGGPAEGTPCILSDAGPAWHELAYGNGLEFVVTASATKCLRRLKAAEAIPGSGSLQPGVIGTALTGADGIPRASGAAPASRLSLQESVQLTCALARSSYPDWHLLWRLLRHQVAAVTAAPAATVGTAPSVSRAFSIAGLGRQGQAAWNAQQGHASVHDPAAPADTSDRQSPAHIDADTLITGSPTDDVLFTSSVASNVFLPKCSVPESPAGSVGPGQVALHWRAAVAVASRVVHGGNIHGSFRGWRTALQLADALAESLLSVHRMEASVTEEREEAIAWHWRRRRQPQPELLPRQGFRSPAAASGGPASGVVGVPSPLESAVAADTNAAEIEVVCMAVQRLLFLYYESAMSYGRFNEVKGVEDWATWLRVSTLLLDPRCRAGAANIDQDKFPVFSGILDTPGVMCNTSGGGDNEALSAAVQSVLRRGESMMKGWAAAAAGALLNAPGHRQSPPHGPQTGTTTGAAAAFLESCVLLPVDLVPPSALDAALAIFAGYTAAAGLGAAFPGTVSTTGTFLKWHSGSVGWDAMRALEALAALRYIPDERLLAPVLAHTMAAVEATTTGMPGCAEAPGAAPGLWQVQVRDMLAVAKAAAILAEAAVDVGATTAVPLGSAALQMYKATERVLLEERPHELLPLSLQAELCSALSSAGVLDTSLLGHLAFKGQHLQHLQGYPGQDFRLPQQHQLKEQFLNCGQDGYLTMCLRPHQPFQQIRRASPCVALAITAVDDVAAACQLLHVAVATAAAATTFDHDVAAALGAWLVPVVIRGAQSAPLEQLIVAWRAAGELAAVAHINTKTTTASTPRVILGSGHKAATMSYEWLAELQAAATRRIIEAGVESLLLHQLASLAVCLSAPPLPLELQAPRALSWDQPAPPSKLLCNILGTQEQSQSPEQSHSPVSGRSVSVLRGASALHENMTACEQDGTIESAEPKGHRQLWFWRFWPSTTPLQYQRTDHHQMQGQKHQSQQQLQQEHQETLRGRLSALVAGALEERILRQGDAYLIPLDAAAVALRDLGASGVLRSQPTLAAVLLDGIAFRLADAATPGALVKVTEALGDGGADPWVVHCISRGLLDELTTAVQRGQRLQQPPQLRRLNFPMTSLFPMARLSGHVMFAGGDNDGERTLTLTLAHLVDMTMHTHRLFLALMAQYSDAAAPPPAASSMEENSSRNAAVATGSGGCIRLLRALGRALISCSDHNHRQQQEHQGRRTSLLSPEQAVAVAGVFATSPLRDTYLLQGLVDDAAAAATAKASALGLELEEHSYTAEWLLALARAVYGGGVREKKLYSPLARALRALAEDSHVASPRTLQEAASMMRALRLHADAAALEQAFILNVRRVG